MEKIKYILLTILLLFTIDVNATSIQIDNSSTLNYYVDLRSDYLYGNTLIQDGIINTTCNYLDNSYGCGIQVPLTSSFPIIKDRTYTISILLSTENKAVQPSTWRQNIVLNNQSEITSGGNRVGIYWLWALDTSSLSVYNADVNISLQSVESNFSIYKIDYTFIAKRNDNIKMVTFAYGLNLNGNATTGTLRFSYLMVDATNQDVVNAVTETNKKLDELNKNITSSNVPDKNELSAKLDTTGWLKPGPVDSIINMPLNLINNLLSSLNNNTCSQLVIDIPYLKNKQLIIPCISTLYEKMGLSSFFNSVGVVASAFILFRYLVGFYKWVDDTLSFREQNWGDF